MPLSASVNYSFLGMSKRTLPNPRLTISRRWLIAGSSLTLLAILWLFIPPYRDAFIGDDYVQLNRISQFLSRPFEAWQVMLPNWQTWYYRPLQNLVFVGNRLLYGLNPFGYYIGLILWHLLSMALVYRLSRQLKLARPFAAAVALLFGLHGHHHDVVTWLSAVAIVAAAALSAAGLIFFARYLAQPNKKWLLAATLITFIAGLLTHEEAFLLPPKLFCLWLLYPRSGKSAANWRAWTAQPWLSVMWAFMALLMTGYLYVQWTRPNLNINLQEGATLSAGQLLDPMTISLYLTQVVIRTTAFFHSFWTANSFLTAGILLLIIGLWFWRANWLGRFGLLWWGLHIAFIYAALWVQRPEFFGGRHLYNGHIGLALAVGATASQLLTSKQALSWQRRWPDLYRYGPPLLLAAFLLFHGITLKQRQDRWLSLVETDQQAEASLKAIVPELTSRTRIFVHRFVLDSSYLEGILKAWYDQPELRGFSGQLRDLPQWGWLPDSIHLLDYANWEIVNLMPELQGDGRYLLLWAGGPQPLTVTGPADDQRLAVIPRLPDESQQWQPLTYRLSLDGRNTLLHVAAGYGFAGEMAAPTWYRIRLTTNGESHILHEALALPNQWYSHTFPLDAYPPGEMAISLEIAYAQERPSTFYWANPHLSRVVE